MEAAIWVNNATKLYHGSVRVVNQVDLEVQPREKVIVIGPAGCGKTTLMRLVCGLEKADMGSIQVTGYHLEDKTESKRAEIRNQTIGWLSPAMHLIGEWNLYENLAFSYQLRHQVRKLGKSAEQEIHSILEYMELMRYRYYHESQMREYEKWKACLAVQLIKKPQIMLLDDCLMWLKDEEQQRAEQLLKEVCKDVTVLAFSVLVEKWMTWDKIYHMENGRISKGLRKDG